MKNVKFCQFLVWCLILKCVNDMTFTGITTEVLKISSTWQQRNCYGESKMVKRCKMYKLHKSNKWQKYSLKIDILAIVNFAPKSVPLLVFLLTMRKLLKKKHSKKIPCWYVGKINICWKNNITMWSLQATSVCLYCMLKIYYVQYLQYEVLKSVNNLWNNISKSLFPIQS